MDKRLDELEEAKVVAERWLDEPYADPDGDQCRVARQFNRALEQIGRLTRECYDAKRHRDILERERINTLAVLRLVQDLDMVSPYADYDKLTRACRIAAERARTLLGSTSDACEKQS
jgi:hypothetical protein